MSLLKAISTQNKNISHQPNFIHLKDKIFAEYNFIFHINDGYLINALSNFNSKDQLLFQKIKSKTLQLNLMMVDSIFPLILADVTLEVFLNGIRSFHEYAQLKNKIVINDLKLECNYLEYKFKNFIHYLLFSDIASQTTFKGIINLDRVYYLKNKIEELKYYSIFEQKEIQELLYINARLEINIDKSFINDDKANICLTIRF